MKTAIIIFIVIVSIILIFITVKLMIRWWMIGGEFDIKEYFKHGKSYLKEYEKGILKKQKHYDTKHNSYRTRN